MTIRTDHHVQEWIDNNVHADMSAWNHPNDAYRIYSHAVGNRAVVQKIFTWHLNRWAEKTGAQRARRKGYKGWRARINGAELFFGKPGFKRPDIIKYVNKFEQRLLALEKQNAKLESQVASLEASKKPPFGWL